MTANSVVRFFTFGKLPNEWCIRNSTFIQDNSSTFLHLCWNKQCYFWRNRSSSLFFWNTNVTTWIGFCQWSASEACYCWGRQLRRNPYIWTGSVASIIYWRNAYNRSQQYGLFFNFILIYNTTCFRQTCCPSSGVGILYSQPLVFVILFMLTIC
jgi:hypothetical protein